LTTHNCLQPFSAIFDCQYLLSTISQPSDVFLPSLDNFYASATLHTRSTTPTIYLRLLSAHFRAILPIFRKPLTHTHFQPFLLIPDRYHAFRTHWTHYPSLLHIPELPQRVPELRHTFSRPVRVFCCFGRIFEVLDAFSNARTRFRPLSTSREPYYVLRHVPDHCQPS
jgi:hypothetical protein